MKIAKSFISAHELIQQHGLAAEDVAASQFLEAEGEDAIGKLELVVAVVAQQTALIARENKAAEPSPDN